jgi:uncharacterized peroxidase-related enzyme
MKDDAPVDAILRDYRTAGLDERRSAMLAFAAKLTLTPAQMTREDTGRLRAAGLDDRDILELAEVVAYYAYVNRIADGLGVELEEYPPRDA